jgi:hypothetical protein
MGQKERRGRGGPLVPFNGWWHTRERREWRGAANWSPRSVEGTPALTGKRCLAGSGPESVGEGGRRDSARRAWTGEGIVLTGGPCS